MKEDAIWLNATGGETIQIEPLLLVESLIGSEL